MPRKVEYLFLGTPFLMTIQWFPGHMNTARREAAKTIEAIDVIVEILDARMPDASSNPMITELRLHRQRPCLKVLNKADLADPAVTQAWLNVYNREPGVNAVALSCNHAGQAARVPGLCQLLAPHRNSTTKPLRMLIMGVPNVGKSTLMNSLLKRRLAKVGNEPAVTKAQQRHILNDRMTLIDSPGLLWPKIEHPVVGLRLATIYAVTAKVVDDEEIAEFLATTLLARYPGLLTARYGCVEDGLDGAGVLEAIATKRGCLRKGKGGELDRDKAAKILLTEYRNGTLGRASLETPDTSEDLV
jgi:ribosome biogenesis GTPase A